MGIFDAVGDLFGGNTEVNIPGESPQQTRLNNLQADQIEQQNNLINALLPSMLSQSGLQAQYDTNGKLTGVVPLDTPEANKRRDLQSKYNDLALSQLDSTIKNAPQQQEIQDLYNKRTLAALKGELPEDPALLRDLGKQEETLNETLRKNLGSGWETSEPAVRAKAEFNSRKLDALEASRRGDLVTASQLGNANLSNISGMGTTAAGIGEQLRGTKLSEMFNMPQAFNPGLVNINPYLQNQNAFRLGQGNLNMQSDQFNSQLNAATLFGIGTFGMKYANPTPTAGK